MTKNNKQDELAEDLLRWAKEDEERSVMLIAGDEDSVRKTYRGSGRNLVACLAMAMSADKELRSICATALSMCENNKANDHDKE